MVPFPMILSDLAKFFSSYANGSCLRPVGLGKNGPGKNGPGKNGPGKNGPEKTVRGLLD